MRVVITIVSFAFGFFASQVEAKDWRGIVPLQSTRATVVQMLGEGVDSKNPGTSYNLDNENVFFAYSRNDSRLPDCIRHLATDLVLTITVSPKVEVSLEFLGLKRESLKTVSLSDVPPTTAAFDDDDGLVVSMSDGMQQIVYLPSKAERARCPDFYGNLTAFVISRIICRLCPTIAVACPDSVEAGVNTTFTANVSIGTPAPTLTYHWTVSAGTITKGQDTTSIEVDTRNLAGKTVTATLEVDGIDPSCSKTASCSTPILPRKP
jgi:hypothetical protein